MNRCMYRKLEDLSEKEKALIEENSELIHEIYLDLQLRKKSELLTKYEENIARKAMFVMSLEIRDVFKNETSLA